MTCSPCAVPRCRASALAQFVQIKMMNREFSDGLGVQVSRLGYRISPPQNRERPMKKYASRFLVLAMFTMALIAVPLLTPAHASGDENPAPPAGTKKEKKDKS